MYVGVDSEGNEHIAGTGVHEISRECPCHPVESGTFICHTGTYEYEEVQMTSRMLRGA
jgi:hypothetical protein